MIKSIAFLLVITLVFAQNQPAIAPAEANMTQGINWDAIKGVIFAPAQNLSQVLQDASNITLQLMIPLEDFDDIQMVNVSWTSWQQLAMSGPQNFTEWDVSTLKIWIDYYVKYHNGVIAIVDNSTSENMTDTTQQAGAQAPAAGQEVGAAVNASDEYDAGTILLGQEQAIIDAIIQFGIDFDMDLNGSADFDTTIDFTQVWLASYDSMDINSILQQLQLNRILWESYAFYDLFFGINGIFIRDLNMAQNATASTDQASMGTAADASGFLQGNVVVPPQQPVQSSTGSTDLRTIFLDIHNRIFIDAEVLLFKMVGPFGEMVVGTQSG